MSLRTRLLLGVAYVLLLALVALGVPLSLSLRDRVDAEVKGQAESQADVVASTSGDLLSPPNGTVLDHLVAQSARAVNGRVLIVDHAGTVLADSAGPSAVGSSYASRAEIASALGGARDQLTRHSQTLGTDILATAVPVVHHGRPIGAVRVTQSVAAVNSAVRDSILGLAALGGVVLVLGLVAGGLIARQIAKPIRRLDLAASDVAAGHLETRVEIEGSSEQRSLSRTFNSMTERIERLLLGQRQFVSDASHQLRTPLAGLRLQLEELRETSPEGDGRGLRLDAGMREIDRLSQMVDELLVLSLAGEHELPAEPVDLAEAANAAVERWRRNAAEAGIALEREERGGGLTSCAPADLGRALDSLIENALRYSAAGTTVTLRTEPGRISVLDRGAGLAPGEAETVFERFNRGSAGRRGPQGTGLGLAIARELIEQWDGSVALESRAGGGAQATISLPAATRSPVGSAP